MRGSNSALILRILGDVYVKGAQRREESGGRRRNEGSKGSASGRSVELTALGFAMQDGGGGCWSLWVSRLWCKMENRWGRDVCRLNDEVAEGGTEVECLHGVGITRQVCQGDRGAGRRSIVPGVSKLWDINKEVNRVESTELENHIHFLDQTVSRRRWLVSGLG